MDEARIRQFQTLKDIALKIIAFISQFEDELVRVWNKPKFVLGSYYVITLDRVAARPGGIDWIADAIKHQGMENQVAEWRELGLVADDFDSKGILEGRGKDRKLANGWRSLPLDTRHFKPLECGCLDFSRIWTRRSTAGLSRAKTTRLLNTVQEKYKNRIKLIYIDPPYNTGQDEFVYQDSLKSASWLTMMEDRLSLCRTLLAHWLICDEHRRERGCELSALLDDGFPPNSRAAIASVKRGSVTGHKAINPGLVNVTEYVPIYAAEHDPRGNQTGSTERDRAMNATSSFIRNRERSPQSGNSARSLTPSQTSRRSQRLSCARNWGGLSRKNSSGLSATTATPSFSLQLLMKTRSAKR